MYDFGPLSEPGIYRLFPPDRALSYVERHIMVPPRLYRQLQSYARFQRDRRTFFWRMVHDGMQDYTGQQVPARPNTCHMESLRVPKEMDPVIETMTRDMRQRQQDTSLLYSDMLVCLLRLGLRRFRPPVRMTAAKITRP